MTESKRGLLYLATGRPPRHARWCIMLAVEGSGYPVNAESFICSFLINDFPQFIANHSYATSPSAREQSRSGY